jgi:hypothetical protein
MAAVPGGDSSDKATRRRACADGLPMLPARQRRSARQVYRLERLPTRSGIAEWRRLFHSRPKRDNLEHSTKGVLAISRGLDFYLRRLARTSSGKSFVPVKVRVEPRGHAPNASDLKGDRTESGSLTTTICEASRFRCPPVTLSRVGKIFASST